MLKYTVVGGAILGFWLFCVFVVCWRFLVLVNFTKRLVVGCGFCKFGDPLNL